MLKKITLPLWIICVLLGHVYLLLNTRFTLWPEMVIYPYLLNNGFILYKDIINPYTPIFTYSLSFFSKYFGYLPPPYQILTWSIIILTDLLIFLISNKIFKSRILATISLTFFIIFSIPFGVNGLWYDLVQTPLILVSFYFAYAYFKSPKKLKSLIIASTFLSIAFFIKQQTVWFYIWLAIIVFLKNKNNPRQLLKNFLIILSPLLLFTIICSAFFYSLNNFQDFVFWTFYFPFFQASKMPGYFLPPTKRQLLILLGLLVLLLPFLKVRDKKTNLIKGASLFLLPFAYPRFDYFHLIPFLALSSLSFGPNLKALISASLKMKITFSIFVVFMILITARFLTTNYQKEVRFFEQDIFKAATLVKILTSEEDRIFIQNGPDQVVVLAQRLPTRPWAIQFPWYLEIEKTQARILEGIKKDDPKLVVYKPYTGEGKYQIGSYKPKDIASYLDSNYQNLDQISDSLWLKIKK